MAGLQRAVSLFIYCFVLLYTKLQRGHTDYWKGKQKKKQQYVLRETDVSIVHLLFVCVWERDLASETFETQEQNPSVDRAFGGGHFIPYND